MAHKWQVVNACRDIERYPDGTKMPSPVRHALLVLATHWPNIRPGLERLAVEMGISESQVARRIQPLVNAGIVTKHHRFNDTVIYVINLDAVSAWVRTGASLGTHGCGPKYKKEKKVNGSSDAEEPLPF